MSMQQQVMGSAACGALQVPWRKSDMKIFRRKKPVTLKRPWSNPWTLRVATQHLQTQRRSGQRLLGCSKPRPLMKGSGEAVSSSQKKPQRNPAQLRIDSHGPAPDRIHFQDGKKHMPAYQNKTQKPFQLFSCISMETRRQSRWKDFSFLINPPC